MCAGRFSKIFERSSNEPYTDKGRCSRYTKVFNTWFVAYLVMAVIGMYLNGLGKTRDTESLEIINQFLNSQEVYLLRFPITMALMGVVGYFGAKKSIAWPFLSVVLISLLVCISMSLGMTIYKNHIPVILGCFMGGYMWVLKQKLNQ
ncbi:hypothetical protein [Neptunomonas japonica]|uniref:hypothetical protein n=1 Tax=Neptunomonas japonica TaxID=417574 RepID=UPI000411ADBA|nr:hypothetical protein [Neptunomonas japonica]